MSACNDIALQQAHPRVKNTGEVGFGPSETSASGDSWSWLGFLDGLPGCPGGGIKPTIRWQSFDEQTQRRKRRRRAAAPRGTCRARACSGTCGVGRLDIALTQAPRTEAHAARTGGPATAHWSRHCRRLAFHQYDDQIANRASPSRLLWCTSSGCPESRINVKFVYHFRIPHFTNTATRKESIKPQIPVEYR